MADLITGYKRIIDNRRHEDFRSLKQQFQGHRIKEIIFEGYQLATAGAGVIIDGSQAAIGAQIAAAGVAYIATEADDSNQDGKKVWVIYQDNTGEIQTVVEHLIAAAGVGTTATVHALGNENVLDIIASGQGTDELTLTTYDSSVLGPDELEGLYLVVYSGNDKGIAYKILSNTKANPTVCTVDVASGAAADADLVQLQEFPCDDYYRVREMYCEVEPLDTKQIIIGTHDIGVAYGAIGCDARYMANSGFFTQPAATCRSFLGKIKVSHSIDSTVTEVVGGSVFVTFTPLQAHANGGTANITIELTFSDFIEWEPCIELAPATDVIVKISNCAGTALDNMFVEAHYLEVYI